MSTETKEEATRMARGCRGKRLALTLDVASAVLAAGAMVLHATARWVVVDAFATPPLFQAATTKRNTAPSQEEGVEIELPHFDELFRRIELVSPLARQVLRKSGGGKGYEAGMRRGLDYVDGEDELKWKLVESNERRRHCHRIDRMDNFMELGCPIFRYRASLKGPCLAGPFADLIMSLDERKKWDKQIADVRQLYMVRDGDLDAVNAMMDGGGGGGDGKGKYGGCTSLGVGYCQTKANLGISPREQLTVCGVQDFDDGSCLIWGTELEEWHNHLMPPGPRHTRAKSHLFCTTMTPTSDDTFDVEYVLQMDAGGNLPGWVTTPVLVDAVKSMFRHAESVFRRAERKVALPIGEKAAVQASRDAEKAAPESNRAFSAPGIPPEAEEKVPTPVLASRDAAENTAVAVEQSAPATATATAMREESWSPANVLQAGSDGAEEVTQKIRQEAAMPSQSGPGKMDESESESKINELVATMTMESLSASRSIANIALMAESRAHTAFKSVVEKTLKRPMRRLKYLHRAVNSFVRRQLAFVRT